MAITEYKFEVTERLKQVITVVRGPEDAGRWLAELPQIVDRFARKWNIRLVGVPDSGAMSCCIFGEVRNQPVVLKIPIDSESGVREAALLRLWSVQGASPKVLNLDCGSGVFLMSRVQPGTKAEPSDDISAITGIIQLTEGLHMSPVPPDLDVPNMQDVINMRLDWADERFETTHNEAGKVLATAARTMTRDVLMACRGKTLLHGDLQPKNILISNDKGLVAIDPLGCIGDPIIDLAFWAVVQQSSVSILERIEQLAHHAKISADLLKLWSIVFAIAELRPYSALYTPRMATFLSDLSKGELPGINTTEPAQLVAAAMRNTTPI